jgi:cytochrome c peroxidase
MRCSRFALLAAIALFGFSCSKVETKGVTAPSISAKPVGTLVSYPRALGLPELEVPSENPLTAEGIALGRRLFYETRLSADNTVSCASCHNPKLGFSDGQKSSAGVGGARGKRNAPSVWNAAYSRLQFWDGRAASLEEQAAGPIANPVEMKMPHEMAVKVLSEDPEYAALFEKVFGPGPVTILKVQNAIASFERTVLSGNAPFDRYFYGGDKKAMTASAIRGLALFQDPGKGNCAVCHTIGEKSALFTDQKFHNLGVGMDAAGELSDLGRFEQTGNAADRGAFKTPGLRNVAASGPYMHDGSLKTLKQVVDFYAGGGNYNPALDANIKPLNLTSQERMDLVAFLEALTGEQPENLGPLLAKK